MPFRAGNDSRDIHALKQHYPVANLSRNAHPLVQSTTSVSKCNITPLKPQATPASNPINNQILYKTEDPPALTILILLTTSTTTSPTKHTVCSRNTSAQAAHPAPGPANAHRTAETSTSASGAARSAATQCAQSAAAHASPSPVRNPDPD